ncbi:hypothetical protein AB0F72_20615 [Actinoplanes sp. NPDC023936]|uniref:hypothetical protein n=1 Tax=Actinoplanes sp. NPDC023936 TaxID=3154910 RepID=UPI0034007058
MTVQNPDAPPWAVSPDPEPPVARDPAAPPGARESAAPPGPRDPAARDPAALPFGGVVPPYGSPANKHGQLLVRFPGEVHGSARPLAPSWRPVVFWTFFLSVLGVIAAMRRSGRARRYGRERAPYWTAFGVTLVVGAAFWSALAYSVALPAYRHVQETKLTTALEDTVLNDGRIAKLVGAPVTNPRCTPAGDRGSDGLRTYACRFTLVAGGETSVFVEADRNGNWEMGD